jgi:16S rRNA (guanine527-N7)-methyltransferase
MISLIEKYFPEISSEQREQFTALYDLYAEWNAKINVVSRKDFDQLYLRHILHSLAIAKVCQFEAGARVLDVGCGGGFPTFPLAICAPDCHFTGLDSTAKKLRFVEETAHEAGISNISTLCARAEEAGKGGHREKYDIAVSRGVARLNVLCEWCMPLVKKGGYFVAMKGNRGREELEEAKNAIKVLGGGEAELFEAPIPVFDRSHTVIVIKKISSTPAEYPRANGRIMKKPL